MTAGPAPPLAAGAVPGGTGSSVGPVPSLDRVSVKGVEVSL